MINRHTQPHNLFVTGLGKQKITLGYPWFKQNNPEIDWEKCTLEGNRTIVNQLQKKTDQEDWKNHTINLIEELDNKELGNAVLISYIEEMKTKVWINAKGNMATELAIKKTRRKPNWPMKNLYWKISMNFWMFLTKTKPADSQSLTCGTTRLIWKKELQSNTWRTKRIGQIPQWEPGKRIHLTISIPMASPFFFVKKERWEIMTLPRLSILKWLDHQKCLSLTIDLWNNEQIKRGKVFFKIWCMMGI